MKTDERIETIKQEGYELDFGTVFNDAFENYKKIVVHAALAIILFSVLLGLILIAVIFMAIDSNNLTESIAGFQVANFSTQGIIAYWVGTILSAGLMSPFTAGIIKMAQSAAKHEDFSVGTVFQYYQNSYFKPLFLAAVGIALFSSTLSVASEIIGYKILLVLITLLFGFLTFLTIPLIIFGNLKAIDAIKGSILIVSKQPLILLALLIVSALFCMIGIIGLCIGIFFTIPFMYSMYYCIYSAIMGDEDSNAETEEVIVEIEA